MARKNARQLAALERTIAAMAIDYADFMFLQCFDAPDLGRAGLRALCSMLEDALAILALEEIGSRGSERIQLTAILTFGARWKALSAMPRSDYRGAV